MSKQKYMPGTAIPILTGKYITQKQAIATARESVRNALNRTCSADVAFYLKEALAVTKSVEPINTRQLSHLANGFCKNLGTTTTLDVETTRHILKTFIQYAKDHAK